MEIITASIDVRNKVFALNSKANHVLSNLQFDVHQREFLAILGPSGCGKTTLLRLIAGLDTDYEGSIIVKERPVCSPHPDKNSTFGNRKPHLVFQESRLLPWFRVHRNVSFALPSNVPKPERDRKVNDALGLVGLSDFSEAWPHQLSGGMAKRVALARALVNRPDLLLLDEPFAALDSLTRYQMEKELSNIHASGQMATVLVTHNIDEAIYLSDRIIILSEKPCSVQKVLDVPLPKPRDRTANEFSQLRSTLLGEIVKHNG